MLQKTLGYKIQAEQSLGIVTFLDLLNRAINCGSYKASKEAPKHYYECRSKRCSIEEAVEIYFKEFPWNEENYDDFKLDIRFPRRDLIG